MKSDLFITPDQAHNLLTLVQGGSTAAAQEVPVGALIHDPNGWVVSVAGNTPIAHCDPTAHAEIQAMRLASHRLTSYRLTTCNLVVSLQPCPTCTQATALARLQEVRFLAAQGKENGLKATKISSVKQSDSAFVDAGEAMLKNFFEIRR
ncbi:nucleoside deaminase [Magnetococcus sp. PR-3]|uniref:nucleoside deaminase n=1 Tax=Magnetococcus sp. PR-3 TaxID=3120355 RepID=UPI002FCE1A70